MQQRMCPAGREGRTAGVGGEWQRVRAFSGTVDARIAGQFTGTAAPQLVTITSTDAGFSHTPECGAWVRTGS